MVESHNAATQVKWVYALIFQGDGGATGHFDLKMKIKIGCDDTTKMTVDVRAKLDVKFKNVEAELQAGFESVNTFSYTEVYEEERKIYVDLSKPCYVY